MAAFGSTGTATVSEFDVWADWGSDVWTQVTYPTVIYLRFEPVQDVELNETEGYDPAPRRIDLAPTWLGRAAPFILTSIVIRGPPDVLSLKRRSRGSAMVYNTKNVRAKAARDAKPPVKKPQFVVKGNKVLAAARKRLKDIANITLKPEIHEMLKKGLRGTCGVSEVKQLRLWCGMLPPAQKKTGSGAGKPALGSENNQMSKKKNGGARKGSGRKKGAATKKTREIADKLAASDEMTPLEYMLDTLRETPEKLKAKHTAGEIDTEQYIVALGDLTRRRDQAAQSAAPYIHPRLSSIEANIGLRGHDKFVELLDTLGDQ